MPGVFLGRKFQACVFFWACNMKLRRTPRHVYFEYPPPGAKRRKTCQIDTSVYPTVVTIVNQSPRSIFHYINTKAVTNSNAC